MKSSNTISWIAIILSICALGVSLVRTEPFTIDSLGFFGWTSAILSLFVTALIGFQIFNYFTFEKRMKEYTENTVYIVGGKVGDNVIKDTIKRLILFKLNISNRFFSQKDFDSSILISLDALNDAIRIDEKEPILACINSLKTTLNRETLENSIRDATKIEMEEVLKKIANYPDAFEILMLFCDVRE